MLTIIQITRYSHTKLHIYRQEILIQTPLKTPKIPTYARAQKETFGSKNSGLKQPKPQPSQEPPPLEPRANPPTKIPTLRTNPRNRRPRIPLQDEEETSHPKNQRCCGGEVRKRRPRPRRNRGEFLGELFREETWNYQLWKDRVGIGTRNVLAAAG